jgi:hypothetical protein
MRSYISFVQQITFILLLSLSSVTQGDPVVLDPNFYIEKFADVNFPIALDIPPVNSPFVGFLYVSSADLRLSPGYGPPDPILRVDLTTRQVTTFYNLPAESDPVWMVFGPGEPFTTDLYISSNNRDGGQNGDYGGSIVFLEPIPDANGECFLTPPPPPIVLSEPDGIAFGPGGAFGTDLFVSNTGDPPYDIALVSPAGARSTFVGFSGHTTIAFGPGGSFGSDLFVLDGQSGALSTVDSNGEFTTFVSIPSFAAPCRYAAIAFSPLGPFGEDMYVSARVSTGVSLFRITPTGIVTEFAMGFIGASASGGAVPTFPCPDGLVFSNDGKSLFVSDMLGQAIYRIAQPRGDMDNDYDVDFVDFALFAGHWLDTGCGPQNNWCGKANVTGDGEVDLDDLRDLTIHK